MFEPNQDEDRSKLIAKTINNLVVGMQFDALSRDQSVDIDTRLVPPDPPKILCRTSFRSSRSRTIDQAVEAYKAEFPQLCRKSVTEAKEVDSLRPAFSWKWGDELDRRALWDDAWQIVVQATAVRALKPKDCAIYMSRKFAAGLPNKRNKKEGEVKPEREVALNKSLWNSQLFLNLTALDRLHATTWKPCHQLKRKLTDVEREYAFSPRTISKHGFITTNKEGTKQAYFVAGFFPGLQEFHVWMELEKHNSWFTSISENRELHGYKIFMPNLVDPQTSSDPPDRPDTDYEAN